MTTARTGADRLTINNDEELLLRIRRDLADNYDEEPALERSHIAEAPWWVVQAVDKKKAWLHCIHHLLGQLRTIP